MKNIQFTKNIAWQVIKDEVFVFDEKNGQIYLLTGFSKDLWNAISVSSKYSDIIKYLCAESGMIETDIDNRIQLEVGKLVKKDLLMWS